MATTSMGGGGGGERSTGLSARFDPLAPGEVPGFAMKVTVRGVRLPQCGTPVVARVGDQRLRGVVFTLVGDGFSGLLERAPRAGDRLAFGMGAPSIQTDVTYGGGLVA